jgi:hypothetical protein
MVEKLAKDNHSSLLKAFANYGRKKVLKNGPRMLAVIYTIPIVILFIIYTWSKK